ncbi:MAG: molecular chaperone [Legionella sp.]|nr:MAG: molecular chaperone [Legionella sp.]
MQPWNYIVPWQKKWHLIPVKTWRFVMVKYAMLTGVMVDETMQISFLELCRQHDISEDILLEMLEHGLISEITNPNKQLVFDQVHLKRILSAHRIHIDLGINSPGVILALELKDELEHLRRQLDILQRHIHS